MSNLLKGLAALASLILAVMVISEKAAQDPPPPVLVWVLEQTDSTTKALQPFWDQASEIEEPAAVLSFDYLGYFLLRGPWDVWKIRLMGGAALSVAVLVTLCGLNGFELDSDDFAVGLAPFLWAVVIKGLLVIGRYLWLLAGFYLF